MPQQPQGYNYPQSGAAAMWQTPQPQYSYGHPNQPQASPHQQPASAAPMRHSAIGGQVQPGSIPYSGMPAYQTQTPGLAYDQTPRQYMPPAGTGAPAVTQGWSSQQAQPAQW